MMALYRIPRSRLWDIAQPLLRRTLSLRVRRFLGGKWERLRALLNISLMRALGRSRRLRVGLWPVNLAVAGTTVCNAACVFCPYPKVERPTVVMPMDLYRRVIDEYVRMGGAQVDLTPFLGEVFLDPFLFERLDYLNSLPGIRRIHFNTNAILMKPQHHQRLAGYGAKCNLTVSFGGFDRETYRRIMGVDGFEAAVSNVRGLVELKRRGGSAVCLRLARRAPPGSERGEFWDYLLEARRQGLIEIERDYDYDAPMGMVAKETLIAAGLTPGSPCERKGPCCHLFLPQVTADGRVNACGTRDVEATLIIGDLKTEKLDEILSSAALHEIIARQGRGDFPEVCRDCSLYSPLGFF